MECNNCDGSGYILKEDFTHDIIVKERCMSCLFEERQKEELLERMRMLLAELSPQMLAHYVSQAIIHIAYAKNSEDALQEQLESKNKTGLLTWITCLE